MDLITQKVAKYFEQYRLSKQVYTTSDGKLFHTKSSAQSHANGLEDTEVNCFTRNNTEAKADVKAKTEAKADAEAKTEAKADAEAKTEAKADAEAKTEAKADAEAKTEAKADAEAKRLTAGSTKKGTK